MTTEDDFQAALDANPEDWQTRLVFADWLQDRGDPRAEGYRALGVMRRWPVRLEVPHVGEYHAFHSGSGRQLVYQQDANESVPVPQNHALPRDWVSQVSEYGWIEGGQNGVGKRRRDVEDAAAVAFAKLPAERRPELLAGTAAAA